MRPITAKGFILTTILSESEDYKYLAQLVKLSVEDVIVACENIPLELPEIIRYAKEYGELPGGLAVATLFRRKQIRAIAGRLNWSMVEVEEQLKTCLLDVEIVQRFVTTMGYWPDKIQQSRIIRLGFECFLRAHYKF